MAALISIVMPVYNGEKFLESAIQSVLAQTYPHWELIVVDDGSRDGSAGIIHSFQDERIRYIYQENRGQAAALNTGLDAARGEYVTTLDADDWLANDSLRARAVVFAAHPEYDVVYADGVYCNEAGERLLGFSEHMPAGLEGDVYDTLIVSPFYGTGATVLERRSILLERKIRYDEEIVWCQDWDIYIRVAEQAKFGFAPEIAINYRLHGAGMTTSMAAGRRLESLIRLRFKVLESQRFLAVMNAQKEAFFYDFLVRDLYGRPEEQERVFASQGFRSLPAAAQGRLMRLAANRYLSAGEDVQKGQLWLGAAWRLAPKDWKTALAYLLAQISPALARRVVGAYQSRRMGAQKNPFEMAGATALTPKG